MQNDWTKPAAMAIPKEGFFKTRWNRDATARSSRRRPPATASRSSPRSSPAREQNFREYGKRIEKAVAEPPDCLAVLKLHYLRWVLFDIKGDTYFMYQGIFDTDFDKYTEDAVAPVHADRASTRSSRISRASRRTGRRTRPRSSSSCASISARASWSTANIRTSAPTRSRRRSSSRRPSPTCSTRCSEARGGPHVLEFDDIQHFLLTRPPARAARYEFLTFRRPAAGPRLARRHARQGAVRAAAVRLDAPADYPLGDRGLHLERPARARRGRGLAGHLPGGVPAGHGGPRGDPRRHGREPPRPLGRRPGQPGPPRHRHPLRARRRGARALRPGAPAVRRRSCPGVEALSTLDLEATPPFDYAHDTSATATGCRSRRSKARATCRRPARARRSRPASSSSAIPTKTARPRSLPQPEILSRNGSYLAYRRMEEHVGAFRDFLQQQWRDARGAGTGRGEADGPLAQRRAAGARARQGRPGARRGPAAEQRLQLQGDGPARATPCRSARTSGA